MQQEIPAKNETRNSLLATEGFLLALIPVIAYGFTSLYEAGFMTTFGLPLSLIKTSLESVFVVFLSLTAGLFLLFSVANLLAMFWPKHKAVQIKIVRVGFILLILMWKLVFYREVLREWLSFLAALIILIFVEFVLPIFRFPKEQSYLDKLAEDENVEHPARSLSLYGRLQAIFGQKVYTTFLVLIFGAWLIYDAGHAKALTQTEYLTLGKSSSIVVLRIYDDRIICASFSRDTKEIQNELILKNLSAESELVLLKERVGPLRLQKIGHN